MKRFLLSLFALALLSPLAFAQKPSGNFEGRIDYTLDLTIDETVDSTGMGSMMAMMMPSGFTFSFKGEKMRLDFQGGGLFTMMVGYLVVDGATGKVYSIKEADKTYTVSEKEAPESSARDMKPTGRKEKIAGHACEEFLEESNGEGGTQSFWLAKDFNYANISKLLAYQDFLAQSKQGGFPLRMVGEDPSAGLVVKMEATKITPEKLDASLFEVPAGYTEGASEMGNMFGE